MYLTFDLHGPGWTPAVIDELDCALRELSDFFRRRRRITVPAPS